MLDLIKATKYVIKGKAANALFPMIVGMKPDLYLRGIKAIAEGERIQMDSAADSDIVPRVERLERAAKRMRLANIAALAGEQLNEKADPGKLNANWRERFVSHASKIADEDMHEAWSRILAGEVNAPGSFSIRAIATVADMQRRDAKAFGDLCQFTWRTKWNPPGAAPLLVVVRFGVPKTPMDRGITFDALKDLESFGLVARGNYSIGGRVGGGQMVFLHAGDPGCTAVLKTGDDSHEIPMGEVSFTTIGAQLSRIVDVRKPPIEYIEACFRLWEEREAYGHYRVERVTRGGRAEA